MTEQTPKCAFCGKHKDEVQHLIEGEDNAFICNECVSECAAMLADAPASGEKTIQKEAADNAPLPTPAELVAQLNEHRAGCGEKSPCRGGVQPLQAAAAA